MQERRPNRALWTVSAVVLSLLLAGLVIFVVVPIIQAQHRHTMTVDIKSTTSAGCTPSGTPPTPGAPNLASLAQDGFEVTDADTGGPLAVPQSVQLVDPCHLRIVFLVNGSTRFVDVVDTTQSNLSWGPFDIQQIADQGWTVDISPG